MSQVVIAKGKSVQEAVRTALDLLSVSRNEVDIEILDTEKKGLLGFRAKPAVVRVTVKGTVPPTDKEAEAHSLEELKRITDGLAFSEPFGQPASESPEPEDSGLREDDLAGKVWIYDGTLFSQDAPDRFPVIEPGAGVALYKNEVLVESAAIVHEKDRFVIDMQDEVVEPVWDIQIVNNKMEAVLTVTPGYRMKRRIKNKAPSHYVLVEAEERKHPLFLEDALIMSRLKEMGVVHGVDYAQIANACVSEEPGSYVIARGSPYLAGKHGYLMPLQRTEIVKGIKERPDGTVDYRDIQEFPSVDRGQIIGVAVPPEPGYPGITVTNEPLFPPEVFPVTLAAGKGVALAEDGTKAVALDAGHPDIQVVGHRARVSVIPKLTIGNDINMETGNIRYIGDVDITGSVQDGMTVQADGNLLVRNHVNLANLSAGNSIIIQRNIISSEASAGKSSLLKMELQHSLEEGILQMKQMAVAVRQLSTVSAFKTSSFERTGLGPLIKILCEGKFIAFPGVIQKLVQSIHGSAGRLEPSWEAFGHQLNHAFLIPYSAELKGIEDMEAIIRLAENLLTLTQETADEQVFVRAAFVQNSQVYSAGDILVTGKGIYNSKLHARGKVEVSGYVRGGEIFAAKGAELGQAGTKGGIPTKITVPGEEAIRIHMAMEDTCIQVGSLVHRFIQPQRQVYARLDEAGKLILS